MYQEYYNLVCVLMRPNLSLLPKAGGDFGHVLACSRAMTENTQNTANSFLHIQAQLKKDSIMY